MRFMVCLCAITYMHDKGVAFEDISAPTYAFLFIVLLSAFVSDIKEALRDK